jgi:hypothetical protein
MNPESCVLTWLVVIVLGFIGGFMIGHFSQTYLVSKVIYTLKWVGYFVGILLLMMLSAFALFMGKVRLYA